MNLVQATGFEPAFIISEGQLVSGCVFRFRHACTNGLKVNQRK